MDVIVNADDLGINQEVNEAVFRLMEQGLVTSATLIANGPFIEEACAQISRFPQCSFGAHLNLTEFAPVSDTGKLDRIVTEEGLLDQSNTRSTPLDSTLSEGVFEELSAQIDKLTSLGVQISHLDSHQYILTMPKMFKVLKKIQRKYKIKKARITRNIYTDGLDENLGLSAHVLGVDPGLLEKDVSKTVRIKKWAYNFLLRHYYSTKTTNGFSGFRLFYEYAKSNKMRHRTFEVVVHPENSYYDAEEAEILETDWGDQLRFPVNLISYHDL